MQIRTARKTLKSQVVPREEKAGARSLFKRLLPLLIFLLIVSGILLVMYWYYFMPRALGRLQVNRYTISSKRSALIEKVHVKIGDQVRANQVLVELDVNELTAKKTMLEKALVVARERVPAQYGNLNLKQDELRLKLDDNLIFRAIDIESARSNLKEDSARYESAIERLKGAEIELKRRLKLAKSGAIAQAKLDEIQTRYNALQKEVANYSKVVSADEKRFETAVKRYKDYNEKNINVPIEEIIKPVKAYIAEAEAEIKVTQAAIDNSYLKAPEAGIVTSIVKKQNEGVQAGDAILSMVNGDQDIVESYVREKWYKSVKLGGKVKLKSVCNGQAMTGVITSIDRVVSHIPQEYLERYETERVDGVRILIKLDRKFDGPLGTHFEIIF